jgi:hypothetical protein
MSLIIDIAEAIISAIHMERGRWLEYNERFTSFALEKLDTFEGELSILVLSEA